MRTLDCIIDADGNEHRPAALERNYARFAALAGVRGDGPAARGLPDDASDTARWLFDAGGYDSPSWLPLDEATRIFAMTDARGLFGSGDVPEFGTHGGGNDAYFGVNSGEGPEFRLVFWFDS